MNATGNAVMKLVSWAALYFACLMLSACVDISCWRIRALVLILMHFFSHMVCAEKFNNLEMFCYEKLVFIHSFPLHVFCHWIPLKQSWRWSVGPLKKITKCSCKVWLWSEVEMLQSRHTCVPLVCSAACAVPCCLALCIADHSGGSSL